MVILIVDDGHQATVGVFAVRSRMRMGVIGGVLIVRNSSTRVGAVSVDRRVDVVVL